MVLTGACNGGVPVPAMNTRLSIPGLGINQILRTRPRPSPEGTQIVNDENERPRPLPPPGQPLVPGQYKNFEVVDDTSEIPVLSVPDVAVPVETAPLPDTAMVDSILLHLLSEHDIDDALHLPHDEASELHHQLHVGAGLQQWYRPHDEQDLRFRAKQALEAAMRYADTLHAADVARMAGDIAEIGIDRA